MKIPGHSLCVKYECGHMEAAKGKSALGKSSTKEVGKEKQKEIRALLISLCG